MRQECTCYQLDNAFALTLLLLACCVLPACTTVVTQQMLPDRIPVDLADSISVELPMWAFRRIPGVADEPGALRCVFVR
jgi:hypothetical protein